MLNFKILIIILLFSPLYYFGQDIAGTKTPFTPSKIEGVDEDPIKDPKEGTYQIILSNPDMVPPKITSAIKSLINSNRKQSEVTLYPIDSYTTIKILPFNTISDNKFIPLEKYKYKSESVKPNLNNTRYGY
ncbi:MAG: hypothetical protein P1U41_06180 [Vicingaceae bacterium]|nr:hypothetical protein [Vicingaceae bacterium]